MSETRLIAVTEEERRALGELVERTISRRDSVVDSDLRATLADDANLLASLAERFSDNGLPVAPPDAKQEALERFVEWFDGRFPEGGSALPGVTLWQIAEQARGACS